MKNQAARWRSFAVAGEVPRRAPPPRREEASAPASPLRPPTAAQIGLALPPDQAEAGCAMSDLTLCPGGECPSRNRCHRFRAVAHGRQDSFGSPPWSAATGTCDSFSDIARLAPSEETIRMRAFHLWERAGHPEGRASAHWDQAERDLLEAVERGLKPVADNA